MDKIHKMLAFSRVAEVGSFTAVADQMESTAGNISRAVSALEDELRTRLFQRTTRKLSLTEAGERYYLRCKQILAEIEQADAEARDALVEPQGKLKVHVMPGLGQTHITGAIIEYQSRFPAVSFELTLAQTMPNLIEEQFDVSIVTATTLPDSAYVSQVLGTSYSILVASPAYLADHPAPSLPDELSNHVCVQLNTPAEAVNEWELQSPQGDEIFVLPSVQFAVNDPEAMRVALRAGAGVGSLAVYSAIDDILAGTLVRVLPDFHMRTRNVYAVYPSRHYVDAKIKTFVAFLKDSLGSRLASQEKELEGSRT
jgi:DNA-binding transcriptional LysR family regulator